MIRVREADRDRQSEVKRGITRLGPMEEGEICSFSDVSELFLGEIIKNCEPFPERMTNRPMQWY